jgi:hypothetical protein
MESFYQVFGVVAALCAGAIILAVFFTGLGYLKRRTRGFDVVKLKGFVKDGRLVNVHWSGGKAVLGVRFVGFTEQAAGKGGVPWQLSSMVVLESRKGGRVLIRADSVRMIEEVEEPAEPGVSPGGRQPSSLPAPPGVQTSDSKPAPSSGGCG